MNILKITGKALLFLLYFALLAVIVLKLFFEPAFDRIVAYLTPKNEKSLSLTIGYTDPLISLSPLNNDTGSRSRLLHIYEPLVSLDPDLKITPKLAVSYGAIDDLTWEFRIRKGVQFHDGSALTTDDVIAAIDEAKNNSESGVRDLITTLKSVQKADGEVVRIRTTAPDPLLLAKMSSILIFKKVTEEGKVNGLVGTGPFALVNNDEKNIELSRFENYWGEKPVFEKVVLKTVTGKADKESALNNGDVDLLANLPADIGNTFSYPKFILKTRPSLESNFLMFGFNGVFADKNLRTAVANALDTAALSRLAQGFAVKTDQFVGDGIFGFNPEILARVQNLDEAKKLVSESGKINNSAYESSYKGIVLDLPKGLESFGKSVSEQLSKVGLDVMPNYLTAAELGQKIMSRESDFYFFGWKFDLGDALDFLTGVIHSPTGEFGQFNGGDYRNAEVDANIEKAQVTLKNEDRLPLMRSVLKTITVDDLIGIPLFSPEVLYAVSPKLQWTPRVDGLVLAQEMKM